MNYTKIKIGGGDTGEPINVAKRITLTNHLIHLENKKILDCGCGAGEYVIELMKFKNTEVYGIEFNDEKVRNYKNLYPSNSGVIQGDIQNMPYENSAFDLVILNEVLEHIPDQKKGLSEIYRVLKPSGHLIVFSPNRFYPFETHGVYLKNSKMKISKAFPFIPYIPLWISNKIFYYPARNYFPLELNNLLKECKFHIKKQTYITQTFEGIGEMEFLRPLRMILRNTFKLIEKFPIFRIPFSVSQVLLAEKLTRSNNH